MPPPDSNLRRHDLHAGRRGDRIVLGRSTGVGTAPIFLDPAEARWLALIAFPALGIAPQDQPKEPEQTPLRPLTAKAALF